MSQPQCLSILVIDPDEQTNLELKATLASEGYQVSTLSDPSLAKDEVRSNRYQLVIVDVSPENERGIELWWDEDPQFVKGSYGVLRDTASRDHWIIGNEFVGNGKAVALGETDGLIKTVFDATTGELLGAHMIGAEVTELIQGFGIAKTLETTEQELMHAVFPHPTLSEMMHESVLDAYGRVIHF